MKLAGTQHPQDQRRRRRFPRYRTHLKLSIVVLGPEGHFQLNGLCNQIGEGGLGAIIGSELSVGEMVNLQLSMAAETEPISVRAVVRWRERLQHGFEFIGISEPQLATIHQYCNNLTEES